MRRSKVFYKNWPKKAFKGTFYEKFDQKTSFFFGAHFKSSLAKNGCLKLYRRRKNTGKFWIQNSEGEAVQFFDFFQKKNFGFQVFLF